MFRLCVLAVAAFASSTLSAPHQVRDTSSQLSFYVASQQRGIMHIAFDPTKDENSSLTILTVNDNAGHKPNWLTSYGDNVYSISRDSFPDNSSTSGGLFAFHKPPQASIPPAALTQFSTASSNGVAGVAINITPDGKLLSAANIEGSTVSIHPLTADGAIQSASYIFTYNLTQPGPGWNESQIQANPHQAAFDPTGDFMFVADRGADRIYVYSVYAEEDLKQVQNITLEPGTGPRHFAFRSFNTTRTYMYLVSELDNTARVFTLDRPAVTNCSSAHDREQVQVTLKQTISTLAEGMNRTQPWNRDLASEIAISSDGKFAYVSNRDTVSLDSDNIAIFSIDPDPAHDAQHLTFLGRNLTYGKTPRHFALSTDDENQYIAVANQYTQSLVVLERDSLSGFVTGRKGFLSLGELDLTGTLGPICILWN